MLCDADGRPAALGKSSDYWIEESDFLAGSGCVSPRDLGVHGFPRDWPSAWRASAPLKALLGKRGVLRASHVYVVSPPSDADFALVAGLALIPLQSCVNASRVADRAGLPVERGWAVYEVFGGDAAGCPTQPSSAAPAAAPSGVFVAQRHWFNRRADGAPVDFTPRGPPGSEAAVAPVLLASAPEVSPKVKVALTAELLNLHCRLAAGRGYAGKDLAVARQAASPAPPRAVHVPPPPRKIEPLGTSGRPFMPGGVSRPAAPTSAAAPSPTSAAAAVSAAPAKEAGPGAQSYKCNAERKGKMPIDYSKFDRIEDSDDDEQERGKRNSGTAPPLPPARGGTLSLPLRCAQTPTNALSLADYEAVFRELLARADPPTPPLDVAAMFAALRACPEASERALLDQACYAVESVPARTLDGGFDGWVASTRQLLQSMIHERRFDEARAWCVIRRLRMPKDIECLHLHAWCLEEQFTQVMLRSEVEIEVPADRGREKVAKKVYAERLQAALRDHLRRSVELCPPGKAPHVSLAGLAASFERSGDIAAAREIGRQGVASGYWADERQRCTHLVRGLRPQQPWHDASAVEVARRLEEAAPAIKAEFAHFMSQGHRLPEVGARSGEALLAESGSWRELPLVVAGRFDPEVCKHFPETVRVLTDRCADAVGLAQCGGGEVAFRVLSPGTRVRPHCGPTNARLTCQLAVDVPLGAEPGLHVGGDGPRPWVESSCAVFDDSFEHCEELDEMADGDCAVLMAQCWHPAFSHKNSPEWRAVCSQE